MQQTSKVPITYDVIIEGERQIKIDWGHSPKWIEKYRDDLDNADRISLIPKQGQTGPLVTVELDGDKRWVIGSRVHGNISGGAGIEFRIYFIGWQKTVSNENVKSIHWIYPGGAVECADNPTLVDHFMQHFIRQAMESEK